MTNRDVGQSDDEAHDLPTEFLDDTSDTHAAWFGFWDGLKGISPKPSRTESMKEPHYYQMGYYVGYSLKGLGLGIPATKAAGLW